MQSRPTPADGPASHACFPPAPAPESRDALPACRPSRRCPPLPAPRARPRCAARRYWHGPRPPRLHPDRPDQCLRARARSHLTQPRRRLSRGRSDAPPARCRDPDLRRRRPPGFRASSVRHGHPRRPAVGGLAAPATRHARTHQSLERVVRPPHDPRTRARPASPHRDRRARPARFGGLRRRSPRSPPSLGCRHAREKHAAKIVFPRAPPHRAASQSSPPLRPARARAAGRHARQIHARRRRDRPLARTPQAPPAPTRPPSNAPSLPLIADCVQPVRIAEADCPPLFCLREDTALFSEIENPKSKTEDFATAPLLLAPLDPIVYIGA